MMNIARRTILRRGRYAPVTGSCLIPQQGYHSYPDPSEKPQTSSFRSNTVKRLDKTKGLFNLSDSYQLDKLFPGTSIWKGLNNAQKLDVQTSKLSNGLVVATQDYPGSMMTTFAFIVKCGSAFEVQNGSNSEIGATHLLEMNAFRSTLNKSRDEIVMELERIGAIVQCIATRENIIYCVDVLKENTSIALEILAETVLIPTFPDEELEESKMIAQYMMDEMPSEALSRDLVQQAGYIAQPLGNKHFVPLDQLQHIVNREKLQLFRAKHFFGSNCVLVGVGIDHAEAINIISSKFQGLPAKGSSSSSSLNLLPPSQYTGGMLVEERILKEPNFVKLAMAFEVGGWKSKHLVSMCVMQQLLGGGSSFSAGGPGKGMYTRLYTQVLNRHYWAESVEAFLSVHEENGMLGIDGACPPDNIPNMIMMIADQFTALAKYAVTPQELSRAKNMLKSMMMMNLESRIMVCEDIARQLITYGERESPAVLCDKIDSVTAQDLMEVATLMLSKPPAIAIVGKSFKNLPGWNDVSRFVQDRQKLDKQVY